MGRVAARTFFFGARPKHRRRGRMGRRIALVLLVAVGPSVVFAAAAFAAYRYDGRRAGQILPGIRIQGVPVGEMSASEARDAIRPLAQRMLERSIQVRAGPRSWAMTAGSLGESVEVDRAVQEALAVSRSYGWASRAYHRLLHKPVLRSISLSVSYDKQVVDRFVNGLSPALRVAPRDAALDFRQGRLLVQPAPTGAALMPGRAATLLFAALRGGSESFDLPVRTIPPAVADTDIGLTIVVRISVNRLYLYDGVKLVKQYPVATGQLGKYPTPLGHFEIITKEVNPTWHNPARTTWGKDEPAEILPGPGNPLGTRAMALSAPGILIHGTFADESIGHYASHGCIRMHIPDSVNLFDRASIGTPVILVW